MKDFKQLISAIEVVHRELQSSAAKAVNQALTIRNWLIGHYIVEYEQNGKDKAQYGEKLISSMADSLAHIKGIDKRSLFKFRQFYLLYPHLTSTIRRSLPPILEDSQKVGSPTTQLSPSPKMGSTTPQSKSQPHVPGNKILAKLSYTHIEQLLRLEDPLNLSEDRYVLYTRGSVHQYQTYPGMYIPAPLEIRIVKRASSAKNICAEILGLTKMNWNNTQFDNKYPITIGCARKVGEIMKYLGEKDTPKEAYAFYM